jgi:hypothetical protein
MAPSKESDQVGAVLNLILFYVSPLRTKKEKANVGRAVVPSSGDRTTRSLCIISLP